MSNYLYRKNFSMLFLDEKQSVRGKLAFKTKETHWLETEHPVIALISIHSAIHKQMDGDLKMNAFISTIKSCTKGRMTILLSDMAHIYTFSMKYNNDTKKAQEESANLVNSLKERYKAYFDSCNVVDWKSYIWEDKNYLASLKLVKNLFQKDHQFKEQILRDAEAAYTIERSKDYNQKDLFIERSIEDILEQCACLLVLSEKGYRFQFYPGSPCFSTSYLNETFLSTDKRISWIDVFLSIEKKIFL